MCVPTSEKRTSKSSCLFLPLLLFICLFVFLVYRVRWAQNRIWCWKCFRNKNGNYITCECALYIYKIIISFWILFGFNSGNNLYLFKWINFDAVLLLNTNIQHSCVCMRTCVRAYVRMWCIWLCWGQGIIWIHFTSCFKINVTYTNTHHTMNKVIFPNWISIDHRKTFTHTRRERNSSEYYNRNA